MNDRETLPRPAGIRCCVVFEDPEIACKRGKASESTVQKVAGQTEREFPSWTFTFCVLVGSVRDAALSRNRTIRRLRSLCLVNLFHKSFLCYTMPELQTKRADRCLQPAEFISKTCHIQSVGSSVRPPRLPNSRVHSRRRS